MEEDYIVEIYSLDSSTSGYYKVSDKVFRSLPSQKRLNSLNECEQKVLVFLIGHGHCVLSKNGKIFRQSKKLLREAFLFDSSTSSLLTEVKLAEGIKIQFNFEERECELVNSSILDRPHKKKIIFSNDAWVNINELDKEFYFC